MARMGEVVSSRDRLNEACKFRLEREKEKGQWSGKEE
jgi:hypothetical protein